MGERAKRRERDAVMVLGVGPTQPPTPFITLKA